MKGYSKGNINTPGLRPKDFYFAHIEEKTLANSNYRQVLYTGPKSQLVLMSLAPGEEIGEEIHEDHDQFFRFESGEGEVVVVDDVFAEQFFPAQNPGTAIIVPAGARHNVINTSSTLPLKLYTIYSPPEHPDGTVQKTRVEAMAAEG